MLFRKSISNTKRFFQKTLQTFKSFLSGGYERLPKTPRCNPFSCSRGSGGDDMNMFPSYEELDMFYTDFTNNWDADKDKALKKRFKKKTKSNKTNHEEEEEVYSGSFKEFSKASKAKNDQIERRQDDHDTRKRIVYEGKRGESCNNKGVREGRACLVAQKLRELEMMDVSNVDHVLDIEEVLHYYSRLTCPAYVDIVDKFFMNMYSEFLGPAPPVSSHGNNSRRMLYTQ
ncbi:hypothetical protein L1049_000965 [Liquidambar formosana]|uniref:OVATE domain-containing protein n=1 Tax=Liquidambar formosana TaxID=63359 RepID=A0AAP0NBZ5_LIQFO